jgi:hypothetical protein
VACGLDRRIQNFLKLGESQPHVEANRDGDADEGGGGKDQIRQSGECVQGGEGRHTQRSVCNRSTGRVWGDSVGFGPLHGIQQPDVNG